MVESQLTIQQLQDSKFKVFILDHFTWYYILNTM
jgi:hypothetical protein